MLSYARCCVLGCSGAIRAHNLLERSRERRVWYLMIISLGGVAPKEPEVLLGF